MTMVARKTSTNPTHIYSYGVRTQFSSTIVEDLLRRQVIYYNTLVELENLRKLWFRELESIASSKVCETTRQVKETEAELEAIKLRIGQERAKERKRSVDPALMSQKQEIIKKLKDLRATKKAAVSAHRSQYIEPQEEFTRRIVSKTYPVKLEDLQQLSGDDLKAKIAQLREDTKAPGPRIRERLNAEILGQLLDEPEWSDAWKQIQRVEAIVLQTTKDARAASNLPHGTYSLAEDSIQAAKDALIESGRGGEDLDRKWVTRADELPVDKSGRVGIQLPDGLKADELFNGSNSRLGITIEPFPAGSEGRSKWWKARNTRAVVRLQVDSKDRKPIYVNVPIIYHRPLPDGFIIKRAWLLARRENTRLKYEIQLTLESPPDLVLAPKGSMCAINLGWRHLDNGMLRIGYLVGSDGRTRDFTIDKSEIDKIDFSSSLQSIRDKQFDVAKECTKSVLSSATDAPDWALHGIEHISQWKDHGRLSRFTKSLLDESALSSIIYDLWSVWKNEHLSQQPKMDLFATFHETQEFCLRSGIVGNIRQLAVYLFFWSQKDKHLAVWSHDQRNKAYGRRDDHFRIWAKWIDSNYEKIIFEDDRLKKSAAKAEDGETEPGNGFRKERSKAAPGYFKEAVVAKSGKTRVRIVKSHFNTMKCSHCGHINDWDTKGAVVHTCGGCGKAHDQDQNNATNQLRIALEGPSGDETTGGARSSSNSARSIADEAAE
jgi:hypothetical protein